MKDYKNLEWLPLTDIKPHPDNPRDHSEDQIRKISNSINELGWGRPLILSKDGYILAGHGVYLAVMNILKLKKVPTVKMQWKHDSPEAIAYMIADNKLTDESGWNFPKLDELSINLELNEFDLTLTGFDEAELKLLEESNKIPEEEQEFDESVADDVEMIKCPECGHEFPK